MGDACACPPAPTCCDPSQDVAEALRRLPPDVIIERNCRLKRALDLSMKHDHLPEDLLKKQTPEVPYLQVRAWLRRPMGCRSRAGLRSGAGGWLRTRAAVVGLGAALRLLRTGRRWRCGARDRKSVV